ncbi:hypothetical protein Ahy_B06g080087 [Arachis hypogaea]|uniref:GH3 middle domain-containing protein n=1 Tax=Arachis hypogaea TaxID=3818 RepID=A0A444YGZ9_ARAHY|nr:hypothetical protein Ahy_B06g080087 [Arachis hypogaea]
MSLRHLFRVCRTLSTFCASLSEYFEATNFRNGKYSSTGSVFFSGIDSTVSGFNNCRYSLLMSAANEDIEYDTVRNQREFELQIAFAMVKTQILQRERRLQDQFEVRCTLEKALGYRPSSLVNPNDNTMSIVQGQPFHSIHFRHMDYEYVFPNTAYFEFLPFNMNDETNNNVADEMFDHSSVEVGKMYEIVVTTLGKSLNQRICSRLVLRLSLHRHRLTQVVSAAALAGPQHRYFFLHRRCITQLLQCHRLN